MSPHRPLEAIVSDITNGIYQNAADFEGDGLPMLCAELIAAVRAERPSSVHLDRGMVSALRFLARNLPELDQADAAMLKHIADAIEASIAPQTPEAEPTHEAWCSRIGKPCPCRMALMPLAHSMAVGVPVSLAPVEGRPNLAAIDQRYRLTYDPEGDQRDVVRSLSDIPNLLAYIERLEADLSRLTLEYRVHMRNITEGEAARKSEVAGLRAKVEALEGVLRQVREWYDAHTAHDCRVNWIWLFNVLNPVKEQKP